MCICISLYYCELLLVEDETLNVAVFLFYSCYCFVISVCSIVDFRFSIVEPIFFVFHFKVALFIVILRFSLKLPKQYSEDKHEYYFKYIDLEMEQNLLVGFPNNLATIVISSTFFLVVFVDIGIMFVCIICV